MLSERFEMRFSTDLLREVDDWRRAQPDLPARAEAIRRLIEANELPMLRIGSRVLIRPADVTDFIDRRVEGGPRAKAA